MMVYVLNRRDARSGELETDEVYGSKMGLTASAIADWKDSNDDRAIYWVEEHEVVTDS